MNLPLEHKRNHIINICLGLIVATTTILLSDTVLFRRLELLGLDMMFHLRPPAELQTDDITVIEITDDEIKEIGRWPWKREWLVKMAEALIEFQPNEILFDFIMNATADGDTDDRLQSAMARLGNVYLPTYWRTNKKGEREIVEPIPKLLKSAKGTGFINIHADIDGIFRRIPLYSLEDNGYQYNVILNIVMDRLKMNAAPTGYGELLVSGKGKSIVIPLVDGNRMLLNWYGPWEKSFKRYSYLDVLEAHEDIKAGREPKINVGPIKGSLCLVALTAGGLYDLKPIPLQAQYPGAGVIATTMANILDGSFIRSVPNWVEELFIYLIVLVPPFLILHESPLKELLNVAAGALLFAIVYALFLNNYMMDIAAPIVALLGSYTLVTTYNFVSYNTLARMVESKQRLNRALIRKYRRLKEKMALTEKEKEELKRVNRELDQFVHVVSHDIRSPLLGIIGYADLLEESIKDSLDEKEKSLFDKIFKSIDRMNLLIDDVLKRVKIRALKSPYEEVDIDELARETLERLAFQIESSQAEVAIRTGLPVVHCDRIKMTAILHNLVSNALKFSSKTAAPPKIEISCKDVDGGYEFCVRDNGIGIDPKDHEAVFELHKRVGQPGQYEGTGVGLNIVKRFVADHGGEVRIESALGEGTAIFFTIPKRSPQK